MIISIYFILIIISAEDLNQEHVNIVSNFMQIIFDNWDLVLIQDDQINDFKLSNHIKNYNKASRKPTSEWNSLPKVILFLLTKRN